MAFSTSVSKPLYDASPIWIQDALVSAMGLSFRYRRSSDSILHSHYRWLLQAQQWSPQEVAAYQLKTFCSRLRAAFEEVPYYRDLKQNLGCEAGDFKSLGDIRLLPVLSKSQVRGQEHRFLNHALLREPHYVGSTSGTTGSPLKCYETRKALARRFAFVARLRTWAGLADPFYPRRAQFTGRDLIPGDATFSVIQCCFQPATYLRKPRPPTPPHSSDSGPNSSMATRLPCSRLSGSRAQ
jgi:phenylacetate-CoA ligase